MRARTKRLWTVVIAGMLLVSAVSLVAVAMRQTADLFYTPTRIAETGGPEIGRRAKVGGLVAPGSLSHQRDAWMQFEVVDDSAHTITIAYQGIAPDLFREGSGVVATGAFREDGVFVAIQLLAKHDETYVPRELRHIEGAGT